MNKYKTPYELCMLYESTPRKFDLNKNEQKLYIIYFENHKYFYNNENQRRIAHYTKYYYIMMLIYCLHKKEGRQMLNLIDYLYYNHNIRSSLLYKLSKFDPYCLLNQNISNIHLLKSIFGKDFDLALSSLFLKNIAYIYLAICLMFTALLFCL